MISFNSLPTTKPTSLLENGKYYATVDIAEMRQGSDLTKPMYLNLRYALKDKSGRTCGNIYDMQSESDKELTRYKLGRFIVAMGLQGLNNFELCDLVKVIKGKQFIVDIKQEPAKDGYAAKNVVDVFSGSIYYPMSEASEIFGDDAYAATTTPVNSQLKINASDAADVHTTAADVEDMF